MTVNIDASWPAVAVAALTVLSHYLPVRRRPSRRANAVQMVRVSRPSVALVRSRGRA